MPGEVIETTGNVEKAFQTGEALDELNNFQNRKTELADGKNRLSANIDKMNKRLATSMDFLTLEDTLSKKEFEMAIEFIDNELNGLETQFNSKVEAANQEFKAPSFSREVNIVDALSELNSGLEKFLTGRLEKIISEADMADEDRNALMARLYPGRTRKEAFGETEVASINKHFRDADKVADMQ